MRDKKILTKVLIVFLVIFTFMNILTPDKSFSAEENRMLQQKPDFTWAKLFSGKFTSEYERYITDQFAYRDFWVTLKSLNERLLQKRDNNNVYLGKDGYLFQKHGPIDYAMLEKNILRVNDFASKVNFASVYFLLVPDSVMILKDKLPPYADESAVTGIISIVRNGLTENVRYIDAYGALIDKTDRYIYYKTDHHWTTEGAYYAYEKMAETIGFPKFTPKDYIIETVNEEFYGSFYSRSGFRFIKPDSIQIYRPIQEPSYKVEYIDAGKTHYSLYNKEHLNLKDKYMMFLDGNHALVKITTDGNTGKKLLVLKDSYAHSFVPFLTDMYDEIHMIDLRYFNMSVKQYMIQNGLDEVLLIYSALSFSENTNMAKLTIGLND